jgi:MFS family permease
MAPPRRRGWSSTDGALGRFLIGLSVLTVSLAVFFRVPFLPSIGIDVGMTDTQLAAITTSFALGRLLIDLPAGRLADAFHPYMLMSAGLLVAAGGSFALGQAGSATVVYASAFLLGVSSGASNTSGLHYFSTISTQERRAASVSIYSSVLLVGQASGPPVAALLASLGTWRTAHTIAAFGLLAMTLTLVFMFVGGEDTIRLPDQPADGDVPDEEGQAPRVWVLYVLPLVMFGVFGTTVHTLVPIIGDDLGLSLASIGFALGIGGAFRFLAIVTGGQIADRVGRKFALIPAIVISAVGVVLLASASRYPSWLVSIIAVSMGSIAISVSATVVADLAPEGRTGRGLARWRFTGDVGMVGIPLLAGWAFERHGEGWALFPLAGALVALALMTWRFVPETRQPGARPPRSKGQLR